jgi:hypothetical protein
MLPGVGVLVSPLPSPFKVVPGEEAVCELRVRNAGSLVDRYVFEILGAAATWTQVAPPELRLLPATEGGVVLHLNPPRQPTPPAGPLPFGLRVTPAEQAEEPVVREGTLEVAPFCQTRAELRPQTARGWRSCRYRVGVANEGNIPVDVEPAASDPDDLLTIRTQAIGRLEPGGKVQADLTARTRKFLLTGRAQPRPFQVDVGSRPAPEGPAPAIAPEAVQLAGTLVQRPLVTWWVILIVLAIIVLVSSENGGLVVAGAVVGVIVVVVKQLRKGAKAPDGVTGGASKG